MNQKPGKADILPEPRIIPRSAHNLSRKNISKGALRVLYRLHEAGFRACLVGGAVRDLLLGIKPKDFDVATNATPEEVRHLFRNCRLIGRRFRLAHVMFGREIVEVATFRGFGDGDDDARRVVDGRLVRDNVWGDIEEDARRRDFRVNALYYDIADFSVIDYVGGMQDLEDRVLRLIGDPEERYREDPVRMLRAARLAAKLGFSIDKAARAPFAHLSNLLMEVAPARLFDESLKLFMAGRAADSFHTLEQLDLLKALFPSTVRQLAKRDTVLRDMVEQCLVNTDQRVAEDRPVTPAFLFAVLLWGEVRDRVQALINEGLEPSLAWQRASHRVVAEQVGHVAIPRRFTCAMEEIWMLQPRFARRTRKRTFRLLEHPRFRAAYDFLLLRGTESDDMRELGEWWTQAQELPPDRLAAELDNKPTGKTDDESPAEAGENRRSKRRGGRRRRRKSPNAEK
ncbi:MAG TPA: polynucleotide adenylyltransferase PcnB [Oleiagrimonas sp.]|nr:polynucleotide adenylyltransferase PcnB [Oleiagrimonas sp.]